MLLLTISHSNNNIFPFFFSSLLSLLPHTYAADFQSIDSYSVAVVPLLGLACVVPSSVMCIGRVRCCCCVMCAGRCSSSNSTTRLTVAVGTWGFVPLCFRGDSGMIRGMMLCWTCVLLLLSK